MTNLALFDGRSFAAFLFDMDGTLLSSLEAAERIWTGWALSHGLDVAAFLPTMHGKRAVDTVRGLGLPGVDPEAEADAITAAEIEDMGGIHEIAGAAAFLASLPPERWAIVTSAPEVLARRRLEAAGIPVPAVFVTADDVTQGKPAPDCYLLAATRLGIAATDCVIFEDAPAGILAAERSGATVVVITATHATHPIETPHATTLDYRTIRAATDEAGKMRLFGMGGE